MDPDDLVAEAFGVLLLQVRTARRALEDVQRNTSRYMGFEFAKALAQGPSFGQPPMFQGALKVHVVNINDLAPGNSFGGFLESLLGGVGSFFSNLIGGTIGGFITSLALPEMIERVERIVRDVRAIIGRLGVGQTRSTPASASSTTNSSGNNRAEAQAQTSETFATTLEGIRGTVRDVTALFQAASSGPGENGGPNQAGETSQTPLTRAGERWMSILQGVNRLLDRTTHLVDGLVLAIPIVVGSIALLVANLGGIRQALLETVQFFLRNALILRGVLLTVIFETVASAARLAASVVGLLATTIQSLLTTIVGTIQVLLGAAFDALRTLTTALQSIVRALLQWMVTGVFDTLRAIGDLSVFRTLDHLVRILPSLLPPIFMLMNSGRELPAPVMTMLQGAHNAAFPAGGSSGSGSASGSPSSTAGTIGEFPDLAGILTPLEATLSSGIDATAAHLQLAATQTFGDAEGSLRGLAGRFDAQVASEADFSRGLLATHVGRIRGEADTLAGTITAPLNAEGQATGLEGVAQAYQDWLTGGGMNALLAQIEPHFAGRGEGGTAGGPLRLERGQFDRPRASVEIDRVEIVLEPAPDAGDDNASGSLEPLLDHPTDEEIYEAMMRHIAELEERAIRPADPRTLLA
ncbi:MAG: hypothetical protein AAF682_04020 [Planctomycetota bacterium]